MEDGRGSNVCVTKTGSRRIKFNQNAKIQQLSGFFPFSLGLFLEASHERDPSESWSAGRIRRLTALECDRTDREYYSIPSNSEMYRTSQGAEAYQPASAGISLRFELPDRVVATPKWSSLLTGSPQRTEA